MTATKRHFAPGEVYNRVDTSILPTGFVPQQEDVHAELLAGLADGAAYDIIQLDPHHDPDYVGLLVNGQLRATYRKVNVYPTTSFIAQQILDRTFQAARAANYLVRNVNRAIRGAADTRATASPATVPNRMESFPAHGEVKEFVTPPMSDGSPVRLPVELKPEDAALGSCDTSATMEFDMGRAAERTTIVIDSAHPGPKKLLDDDELENSIPAFLAGTQLLGRATAHPKPTEEWAPREIEEGHE